MQAWRWWFAGAAIALVAGQAAQAALLPVAPQEESAKSSVVPAAAGAMLRLPQDWTEAHLLPQVEEARQATASGKEGVVLAARLVRDGGLVRRPVSWEIIGGEQVRRLLLPQAEVALKPGHYEVRVRYGLRHVRHAFQVRQGEKVQLVFVLNVGGLRALARVQGVRQPLTDVRVEHRIVQRQPDGSRKVLAVSAVQGEIIRLPAGLYELESHFRPGNAKVITPVRIKPGRLHGYEITAKAAVLQMENASGWSVRALDGSWAASGVGKRALVLAPGSYEIRVGSKRQRLDVKAGEQLSWPAWR